MSTSLTKLTQVPDRANKVNGDMTRNFNAIRDDMNALKSKFNDFWPLLLKEISSDPEFEDMPLALDWLNKVMEKNVPCGKQNRALAFINVYNEMVGDDVERIKNEKLCMALGWVMEIFQAAALMADDMMDESKTRRGIKCWYKENDVGMTAVNDSFLLENLAYFILYKYFGDQPYFGRLLHHHHSITMKTIMGQCMDTRFALNEFNLDDFTLETYRRIVTYKTSYYSFYYPVAAAMIMTSMTHYSMYDAVRDVTLKMGFLFQVQDDFLDCFGDPEVTGKIGTDIEDRKCTWLIVKALELTSDSQRKILQTCYGKKSVEDKKSVKKIYDDLDIEGHYRIFEKQKYEEVSKLINALPESLPKTSFKQLLNRIDKRSK